MVAALIANTAPAIIFAEGDAAMKFSIAKLAAAWSKGRPQSSPAPTPAKPRYRGFGRVEIHPRDGRLQLPFPDDTALLQGVAALVDGFAADRPRSFFERCLRNSIRPMM